MNYRGKFTLHLFLILLCAPLFGQVVDIPDPNLNRLIRQELDIHGGRQLTQADMLRLTHIHWSDEGIADLTGLEHATNLEVVIMNANPVTDLSPLGGLLHLEKLHMGWVHIRHLDEIANVTSLKDLYAARCGIEDISGLAGLINLVTLNLAVNEIVDISSLANLTNLGVLNIQRNPIVDYSPISMLSIANLHRDEECDMPGLPVHERIENRSLPSVVLPWDNGILNRGGTWWDESITYEERVAFHSLWWHGERFRLRFMSTAQGYQITGDLAEAVIQREELLAKNPNMLVLVVVRQKYASLGDFPEDWFGWIRDDNGKPALVDENDPLSQHLIDYRRPEVQDVIVQQAVAVAKCGLYDGIMFDAWGGDDFSILRRIREGVPGDFLILFNTNHGYIPELVAYINGSFMETFPHVREEGYTRERILEIETNLMKYEANAREPQINCLRGFGIGAEAPDSPNNRRWMRLFTTMSLTCSDGYVIYTLGNIGGQKQYQKHIWHPFWDADLGQPVGATAQLYQGTDGLYIREFTNGWAVYNRSGAQRVIALPEGNDGRGEPARGLLAYAG